MMLDTDIEHFNDSLTRCLQQPTFLERFYELFIASSEEVRLKFKNTDLKKQQRMLKASFYMLMLAESNHRTGQAYLERIAARHSKEDLDIPPHLYDAWLACLVQAVSECDPQFTAETAQVWRWMMQKGMAFMQSRYNNA